MKTLSIACLTALLTLTGFVTHTSTSQAKKPTPKVGRATKYPIVSKPDLRCRISVWEDAAMTKPVTNGQVLGYGGGGPKLYAQAIIENRGLQNAGTSSSSVTMKRNNGTFKAFNDSLAIPAGLAKIYPTVQIPLQGASTDVEILVQLDKGGAVNESSELNNTCKFTTRVNIVQ
ncbi:MAG: hypothetical protein K0V04_00380 [Deltaproteobacteria bacterium]|nr:hypothetical protein [Deltaproteobacteria bacterium]